MYSTLVNLCLEDKFSLNLENWNQQNYTEMDKCQLTQILELKHSVAIGHTYMKNKSCGDHTISQQQAATISKSKGILFTFEINKTCS